MSTIFDIAREAGVSITTVSRALNGYSDVSVRTRERIVQIAERLHYYPNAAARNLQGKRSNTVGFAPLLRQHVESEPFFKEFIGVLTLSCFRHNLSLLATVADRPQDTVPIYRELAGSGRVDGIIVADIKPEDERIDLLRSTRLPFVAFGRTNDYASLHYPFVDLDGGAGIRSMVEHLFQRGHQRIAYFTNPLNTSYAQHRYSGYRAALVEHGITLDQRLVKDNLQDLSSTEHAVRALMDLSAGDRPTAIVTSNDHLAVDVMQSLERSGVQPGARFNKGQVAVTGFDNLPFTAYLQPSLTTISQTIDVICDLLLDMLVSLIEGDRGRENAAADGTNGRASSREEARFPVALDDSRISTIGPRQVLVAPQLVIRESA